MKRSVVLCAEILSLMAFGYSKNDGGENYIHGKIGGNIIVFTNRTNIVDAKVQEYRDVLCTYPMVATVSAGIVYNKAVFEKAGVGVPRNTEEFYEAMQKIKDKTNAVSVFMNYPSGWTLNQWEGGLLSASGDQEYKRKIIHEDSPFASGDGHYELYKMMYEVVKRGLCEKDLPVVTLDDGKSYYKISVSLEFQQNPIYTFVTICPAMGYVKYNGPIYIDDIILYKKD